MTQIMPAPILRTGPVRKVSVRFDESVKPPACETPCTSTESTPVSEDDSEPFFKDAEAPKSAHATAINDAFSDFLAAAGRRRGALEEEVKGLESWRDDLREECKVLEEVVHGAEERASAILREAAEAREEAEARLEDARDAAAAAGVPIGALGRYVGGSGSVCTASLAGTSMSASMSMSGASASCVSAVSCDESDVLTDDEGTGACNQIIADTSARGRDLLPGDYASGEPEDIDADDAVERGEEAWARGDHGLAMRSFQAAFAIERARYGRDHPDLVDTLQMIGLYYTYDQKWEDAIVAYGEKLRIQKIVLGDQHERVAETLCDYIGEVYVKACQFENAVQCFKEAARIFKANGNEESKHNAKKGVAYAEKQLAYQLKYEYKQQKYSSKQESRRRNRRLKA